MVRNGLRPVVSATRGVHSATPLILLAACATLAVPAHAQFDSGAVLGSVRDNSGAVVAGATVELTVVGKGIHVVRQADHDGAFEFDSLQPGDYMLMVSATGFSGSQTESFHIDAGARRRVDLALAVGEVSDAITVTDAPTALDTETSDRCQIIQVLRQ